jgi:peptidase E
MSGGGIGQIVAIGGGGVDAASPALDDFVLSLSPRQPARLCLIATASAEAPAYMTRFYRTFSGRAIVTDLTLFDSPVLPRNPPSTAALPDFVAAQDILFVTGGNTANMLSVWRAHGLDRLLSRAWSSGAVLAGMSAGMICWFKASITDSFGPVAPLHDGLGLIDASACPHYDGEVTRRPAYHRAIAEGMPPGYAADDGAALHFVGSSLREAVSYRPGARAYRVERGGDGQVVETPLPTRALGG